MFSDKTKTFWFSSRIYFFQNYSINIFKTKNAASSENPALNLKISQLFFPLVSAELTFLSRPFLDWAHYDGD